MTLKQAIQRTSNSMQRISKTNRGRRGTDSHNFTNSRSPHDGTSHYSSSSTTHDDGSSVIPQYFQGLNFNEGKLLMESIQRENQEFLHSVNKNRSGGNASDVVEEQLGMYHIITDNSHGSIMMVDEITPEEVEDPTNSIPDRKQQEYQKHRIDWGKRNWGHIFELFDKYEGDSTLTVPAWFKLLEWFWSTLSKPHMSELQGVLQRIRTIERRTAQNETYRANGTERTLEQQELIRAYNKIIRLENLENLNLINKRLWLVALYENHTSYSEKICGSGKMLQQRQQQVNQFIYQIFNREIMIQVTMQTIKNHIKEGRHWHEVLFGKETRSFGYGLLFLLPVHGYKDLARKTSNPVWTFLLQQIPPMSRRITDLAKAFHPIMKATDSQVSASVTVSLLGYELMVPIDLDNATGADFKACIRAYPNLHIKNTLKMIQIYGRLKEPQSIEEDLGIAEEGHQKRQQGAVLMAVDDPDETSEGDEEASISAVNLEEQSSSAEDEEDESTSAEDDKSQSISEEEDREQSIAEDEEEEHLTADKGKEVQASTATSTNATNTRVELEEIGISLVLQDDVSANNISYNEAVSNIADGGSMVLQTNLEQEQMNDKEENLPTAIDGVNKMLAVDIEEHQNQSKAMRDPDIEVFASIEVDESFAANVQQIEQSLELASGRVSETQMTRIDETIPEMSEIIEPSWNDLVEDMVENDEDIMQDL
ncbi:hypothetical protein HOY82DRAFT_542193 [Tuber indicum]|nr:hypothetical protein HOY82DRAFT_542193 [Tuber indicum]